MQRRSRPAETDAGAVGRAAPAGRAGRGYVDFALAEPGLFRVVFTAYPEPAEPEPGGDRRRAPGATTTRSACSTPRSTTWSTVGFLAASARPGAEIICWSAVHGFAVLHTEGPLRGLAAADRDAALDHVLATIDRGYGATPARHPAGHP